MTSTTFFIIFVPILAILLLAINLLLAPHNPYQEKDSVFECGFHSFLGQNRTQFSVSFFIFGLLFLLFDLEVLLVFPYSVSSYTNDIYGLVIMMVFFVLLTLGFVFELGKNALTIDSRQTHSYTTGDTTAPVAFTENNVMSSGPKMITTTFQILTIMLHLKLSIFLVKGYLTDLNYIGCDMSTLPLEFVTNCLIILMTSYILSKLKGTTFKLHIFQYCIIYMYLFFTLIIIFVCYKYGFLLYSSFFLYLYEVLSCITLLAAALAEILSHSSGHYAYEGPSGAGWQPPNQGRQLNLSMNNPRAGPSNTGGQPSNTGGQPSNTGGQPSNTGGQSSLASDQAIMGDVIIGNHVLPENRRLVVALKQASDGVLDKRATIGGTSTEVTLSDMGIHYAAGGPLGRPRRLENPDRFPGLERALATHFPGAGSELQIKKVIVTILQQNRP